MKHKHRLISGGGPLVVALLIAGCGTAPPQSTAPPAPYIRIHNPSPNEAELQIAARKFAPAKRGRPIVWLAAVSHIGDRAYYQAMQELLDSQDLVLFEGVGGPPDHDENADQASEKSDSLQSHLAAALGLVFQFDGINYDRANFQNSDLTVPQLQGLLLTDEPHEAHEGTGEGTGGGGGASAEFDQLMALMDGSSVFGAFVNFGLNMIANSPPLRAVTRLVMIETLGNLKGDLSESRSLPPDMRRLIEVIISERNKVVMADLRRASRQKAPPHSVAIFYGAGHMANLETRLRRELDYRPVEDVWFSAFTADTRETGLSEGQLQWMREMLRKQLNQFQAGPAEADQR